MASVHAAAASAAPPPASGITADDLKRIDIGHLSQSELQALSLSSNSAFDLWRTDNVVCPQLDRSVFNESAGSRRQTYSRLHHRSHSRLPGLHPSFKPHRLPNAPSDHVSHSIVHFLKHFLSGHQNPPPPPPTPPSPPPLQEESKAAVTPNVDLGFLGLQNKLKVKRKRGWKSKNLNKPKVLESVESGARVELQRVNFKGEVVDFAQLEKVGDEFYNEELKRRTMGLETEDGVLGFLWSLEGQWCSRRRKRKYVDAAVFGDVLPIGWKLLLGLRRRDFRVSVYCRRYISPSGQQFLSCKEAALFLKSYFKDGMADQNMDQKTYSIQQNSPSVDKAEGIAPDGHLTTVKSSSNGRDDLKSIENPPEVQVEDVFECVSCNLTFDEKNVLLQHQASFHQKTNEYETPVGEDVIVKDGKYVCQFCHEIFLERDSYNCHVGVHVKTYEKDSNELTGPGNLEINPEPPLPEDITLRSSKMDALIEIAQNSIFETSTVDTDEQAVTSQPDGVRRLEEPCREDVGADRASNLTEGSNVGEANLCLDPVEPQKEDRTADGALCLGESLNHHSEVMTVDNDMVENDYAWDMNVKINAGCMNDSEPTGMGEMVEEYESSLVMGFENSCLKQNDDHPGDTPGIVIGANVFHDGISSVPLAQPFDFFPPFDSVSNKAGNAFPVSDQKLPGVTGFEELGFDMEPFRYSFVNEPELPSLPGGSMDLRNDSGIDDGFNSAVRFGSELMLDGNQLTVCVWCRTEFKLEGIDSETASDSIGYMCPTCKTKISGHFTHGLSLDPRSL